MYYRRKIILSLLELIGREISKLDFQKLLFLFSIKQETPAYNFVPYKFGCYSFLAAADLSTLSKYGTVKEGEKFYSLIDNGKYFSELTDDDKEKLKDTIKTFGNYSTDGLIKYVYKNYPYYAINSLVAKDKLNANEIALVQKQKPSINTKRLFTIGYEGISVEEYFNRIITNDIKVLCDVRNSPHSMKYGFSKSQLEKFCDGLGIIYIHIPGLGIESDKRQQLVTQDDYDTLFNTYRITTLNSNQKDQQQIKELLNKYNRIALTCFEKNIHQCHRYHLANSITTVFAKGIEVEHI